MSYFDEFCRRIDEGHVVPVLLQGERGAEPAYSRADDEDLPGKKGLGHAD